MNILQIGTTDLRGGAAQVSWYLKTELEKNGYQMPMFVADKLSDRQDVYNLKRSAIRKKLNLLLATDRFYNSDAILKSPAFKSADLVHCHNLHGRFFSLMTLQKISQLKPVVWTLHDEWAITPHCVYTLENQQTEYGLFKCPNSKFPERILWPCQKKLSQYKQKIYQNSRLNIVTPSRWLKQKVEQTILGKLPLHLIYNGIDTEKFYKVDSRMAKQKLGLPLDKTIVLFIADEGQKVSWKGWSYTKEVINNFKSNALIHFVSIGSSNNQSLENPNVSYFPIVKQNELKDYYSAVDLMLVSSLADNCPLVVLEAMACGLPVVSFKTGGIPELIEHRQNGWLANYRDVGGLISGLNYFLSLDEAEIKRLSDQAIAKIRNYYNLKRMVDEYLNLYQNLTYESR